MADTTTNTTVVTTTDVYTPSEIVLPDLIELLKLVVKNPDSKINIRLSDKMQGIITTLIETNPTLFKEFNATLLNIIKDGKIDSADIPEFVILVQKVYEIVYISKQINVSKEELADSCGIIAKFVVHTLIEKDYVKMDKERKVVFLSEIDNIIDVCVSLIKVSKTLKTPGCIKKLFGAKK
jgi:hypothetical protein